MDLPESRSTSQLVYFGLTQICGNTCVQVLALTGQVPVKSQVLTDILVDLDHPSICKYSHVFTNVDMVNNFEHGQFILLVMQTLLYQACLVLYCNLLAQ